ncbi:MAG: hypothetical protein MRERC_2c001 [Mycoplasmataceae bacterium RC_NB112A]|nr:MAG: hypothetical protein MRERC_6c100 [Mycoplasmataceae bacterium RC_NB112A]KLL02131.1 MAG: hypothetical protein MRERC_4c090 [Mycoplasmataceae bacterium RC_NB112A]KLL02177.1 MAG: hypothetical protein MRERC_4c152 [Mycoplasmataceae bacterium RC_NB112A]KLL02293.1 MAG: hypothetical protein MRERC_2c001 [Mycoplasmataceae bacterium RC_NB112A]
MFLSIFNRAFLLGLDLNKNSKDWHVYNNKLGYPDSSHNDWEEAINTRKSFSTFRAFMGQRKKWLQSLDEMAGL